MRWRSRQRPPAVPRFTNERDALAHLIATTDNAAVAELARLRLRAARFADEHLTSTTPPTAAPTPESLDAELRRSLATTTAAPHSASLVDVSAKMPAIDRIAEANRGTIAPAARPMRFPPLLVGGLILLAAIASSLHLNRGWLANWIAADPPLAASIVILAVVFIFVAARVIYTRLYPERHQRVTFRQTPRSQSNDTRPS